MRPKHVLIIIGVIILAIIYFDAPKKTSDPCKAYRGIATRAARLKDNSLAAKKYIVAQCSERYSDVLQGLECVECCGAILGLD